jgi:hypothetical protein
LKARQETSFCMAADLEQLQKDLSHCLYYLFESLRSVEQICKTALDSSS